LSVAGPAGVAASIAPKALAQARQPVSWRLQGAWLAKDILQEYALDFGKKINDMSGGRLRVEIYAAGGLVKATELLDAVHKGVIDGCFGVSALWHGRDITFSLFGSGPALGLDGNGFLAWLRHGDGMAHYHELVYRHHRLEVTALFGGPMPPAPLGWFRRPIKSAADFKGLRIGASGLAAEMFGEMGAHPVVIAPDEAAAALKNGKLDAAQFNNVASDQAMGLADVARSCLLQSHHRTSEAFEVLLNRGKFEALPGDLQAIVRHAIEAASADMSWKALHRYSEAQAQLVNQGIVFQKTPEDVLRAQLSAWRAVTARLSRQNPLFERVFLSQQAWARRTVAWSRATLVDPALAYDFWFGAGR
jgi:TRAP-type mannitol/chloroaromatic compound transport system substrate-binding protein